MPPSYLTHANAVVLSVLQRRKRATPERGRKSRKMRRVMSTFASTWAGVVPLASEGLEEEREEADKRNRRDRRRQMAEEIPQATTKNDAGAG